MFKEPIQVWFVFQLIRCVSRQRCCCNIIKRGDSATKVMLKNADSCRVGCTLHGLWTSLKVNQTHTPVPHTIASDVLSIKKQLCAGFITLSVPSGEAGTALRICWKVTMANSPTAKPSPTFFFDGQKWHAGWFSDQAAPRWICTASGVPSCQLNLSEPFLVPFTCVQGTQARATSITTCA